MEGLRVIPYLVLMIGVAAIITGAVAISISKFKATTTDTTALAALGNASSGITTIAEQFPTVAIVGIMVVIIGLIAGVFAYFRFLG